MAAHGLTRFDQLADRTERELLAIHGVGPKWLFGFRRLRIRDDICDERFYAFVLLACSLVCFRTLITPPW